MIIIMFRRYSPAVGYNMGSTGDSYAFQETIGDREIHMFIGTTDLRVEKARIGVYTMKIFVSPTETSA